MMNSPPIRHRALTFPMAAAAAASLVFAACSSSTKTSTPPAAAASPTTAAGANNSAVTVGAAKIPGLGTVLVNGDGRTLYVLASEKGGTVTCTATGGCTTVWPPLVVPAGMSHGIAGSGIQASLLGTVKSPAGDTRLTYGGWPLYTFTGDSRPGQDTGQALTDSYGIWWALSPSGNPITTAASSSPSTPAATSPPATSPPATSPASTSPPASPTTTAPATGGAGF